MSVLDLIVPYLPYAVGAGFISIGLLVALMPVPSLMKLDPFILQWVHAERTPLHRMQIVTAGFKAVGSFLALSGTMLIVLTIVGIRQF